MIQIAIVTIKCAALGDVMPSLLKVRLINLRGSLMYGPFILRTPAATASLTQWYAMALCFFLRVGVGIVEFVTTYLLLENTFAGPSIGIPNILNL
jgi:hypothetical protein